MAGLELPSALFTDRYTSAKHFEQEKQTIFRKTWVVVARDSDIPKPGDCLPVDELDESFVLIRGNDGIARAFRNACRHRGTRLLSKPQCTEHLECPYHGWRYDLEGKLVRVPDAGGFEGLDLAAHGLLPIRTESFAGFIWITLDDGAVPLRDYLGTVAEQLEPYRLGEMRAIRRRVWTLPCNWKAFLDNNSERYHVASVHPTWSAILATEEPVFHDLGIHHLFSVAMANYRWRNALDRISTPRDLAVPPDQAKLYQRYLVFPNTLISVLPYQMTVFRVFPIAPDQCRFHYEFHIRKRASLVARLRGWLTQLASQRIVEEDNAILGRLQQGLGTAGRQAIPLHREEKALEHFHRVVDRYITAGT